MYSKRHKIRLVSISFLLIVLFVVVFCRLFFIQVVNATPFQNLADSQQRLTLTLPPLRGTIYDSHLRELAVSLNVNSLYAAARQVVEKEKTARTLAEIFDRADNFYLEKLNRDKMFVWLERKIPEEKSELVARLKLEGLGLLKEGKRFYPNAGLAGHIIGFSGIDNDGLEGLERHYDKYLKGEAGYRSLLRDAKQRSLPVYEYDYVAAKNGYSLVLTIDQVIQYIAEEALDRIHDKYNAKGASIVVLNPHNGDILAMANCPAYNLNEFYDAPLDYYRNRAVSDIFEPGSVFKVITAAALLEEKLVTFSDRFFCENGKYHIGRRVLHDHQPHGWLTFQQVIEESSNIGTVKAAQRLGQNKLYNYIRAFGFGKMTGVNLPGEVNGIVTPPAKWSKTSMSAIPMGQEVAVTSLQLAAAISVIANGGYLPKPRIIQRIVDENKELIAEFKPEMKQRVISAPTAAKMKVILRGAVERGTGKAAALAGFSAAGKTGTAQKVEPNGRYSHSRFTASFIGFAPVDNPRVVIVVNVDEPRPYYYGGVVAAPVFKEAAEKILKYLNIPEDKPKI